MKVLLSCLVVLGSVACNLAIGPNCECGIYSPSKSIVDMTALVRYSTCAPDDTSCTCEQRSDACMEACYENAKLKRPSQTRIRWRDTACSRENRLIGSPGEKMVAGARISWVNDCPSPAPQYKSLPKDPLCCRLAYSRYISTNCAPVEEETE